MTSPSPASAMASAVASGDPLRRFQKSLESLDCPSWMASAKTADSQSEYSRTPRRASNRQSYRQFLESRQARASAYGNAVGIANYAGHRSSSYDANIVRWSSSTLSGVTPTDSVDSCPYPPFRTGAVSRISNGTPVPSAASAASAASAEVATATNRRPYLGWRSTDNLEQLECKAVKTPSERLLLSRTSASSAGWRYRSTNSLDLDASSASSTSSWQRPSASASTVPVFRPDCRVHVHESIRSVTSAIVEFCSKDSNGGAARPAGPDRRPELRPEPRAAARPLPTFEEFRARPHTAFSDVIVHEPIRAKPRPARSASRPRVVWLESSFVSAAEPTKTKT